MDAFWPRGQGADHGPGYQVPPASGLSRKHAPHMSNTHDLFCSYSRDEKGGPVRGSDCDEHQCFAVQGKKQGTNTPGKAETPQNYWCTITCAFYCCGKHYEDSCYSKQCLSAKLKSQSPLMGVKTTRATATRAKASRKAVARGKTKTKEALVVLTGGRRRTRRKLGNTPALGQGGENPDNSGGQQNRGPTTRSRAQAHGQQEQGAKNPTEESGDESGSVKRSCIMRMVRKLCQQICGITLQAEF